MTALIAIAMNVAAAISGTCDLTSTEITSRLEREDPRQVVKDLWDGGVCEENLLSGLASGEESWLRLAVALRPHTDAWASESISIMLGMAMLKAPSRVLPLVGRSGFDNMICFPWDVDDSPEGLVRTQQRMGVALPMFERFLETSLAPQAKQCLSSLHDAIERNPTLRPNQSLERSRGK